MFFCITLFLLSFWDSNDTNVNPYVTGPLFSKTLIIFSFFFTVQLGNFLFPMNSVTLSFPLHSATESTQFSIFYYNYHFTYDIPDFITLHLLYANLKSPKIIYLKIYAGYFLFLGLLLLFGC